MNTLFVRAVCPSLLLVTLACGCASPRSQSAVSRDAAARAEVESRLAEIVAAAEAKDFERLEACHLYGPKFTKFSGRSAIRLDAEASRKGERAGLSAAQDMKMHAEDLRVDVFDKTAVATFILSYSFQSAGRKIAARDRATLVFVKDGPAWKITHEHLSPCQ